MFPTSQQSQSNVERMQQHQQQPTPTTLFGQEQYTDAEKVNIRRLLEQKLGKDFLSERPGSGGQKFTYVESHRVVDLANQIFGPFGWSTSVVDLSPDYAEFDDQRKLWTVGASAIVRVTIKNGAYREDVGYGNGEDRRKYAALESAKKEAVTDSMKRALRLFGNALGNSIYDKQHVRTVKQAVTDANGMVAPTKRLRSDLYHQAEEDVSPLSPERGSAAANGPMHAAGAAASSAMAAAHAAPSFAANAAALSSLPVLPTHQPPAGSTAYAHAGAQANTTGMPNGSATMRYAPSAPTLSSAVPVAASALPPPPPHQQNQQQQYGANLPRPTSSGVPQYGQNAMPQQSSPTQPQQPPPHGQQQYTAAQHQTALVSPHQTPPQSQQPQQQPQQPYIPRPQSAPSSAVPVMSSGANTPLVSTPPSVDAARALQAQQSFDDDMLAAVDLSAIDGM